jgi:hypothetical protein
MVFNSRIASSTVSLVFERLRLPGVRGVLVLSVREREWLAFASELIMRSALLDVLGREEAELVRRVGSVMR